MPKTTCKTCFGTYAWQWEDAFDKFGFNDGDGQVMTDVVIQCLDKAGYEASSFRWGAHNEIIASITKDGVELIPHTAKVGYDDPRRYLPKAIVRFLDERLPDEWEVGA